ncbi:MAG TPA: metallophosphoesterase [Candidatus Acidoferrales bacterium]|nr:metallophosphoesterase [Candidatus Acidoferrales bacterium]
MKHRLFATLMFVLITVRFGFAQQQINSSARFLIIGDWGGFASENQKAVAAAMGRDAEKNQDQFVVTVGDNYHGKGISSATDSRWKTEYEDIYSHASLQIPWYPTLGNHDYEGSPQAELDYSNYSKRWDFHSRYYAQEENIDDSTKILIVHLDTPPFVTEYQQRDEQYHVKEQDPAKQVRWLDSLLSASNDRWVIVVGHHPIYSAAPTHGDTPELIYDVLPVLERHHIPVYICGHDHVMQHLCDNGIDFFVCGGGAEHRDVNKRPDVVYGKGSLGFLSVTAYRDSLNFRMIDENSAILHEVTITK